MRLRCRYENVDSHFAGCLAEGNADAMRADFEKMHKTRYGYHEPAKKIIAAVAEAEAKIIGNPVKNTLLKKKYSPHKNTRFADCICRTHQTDAFYDWRKLSPQTRIIGPAVVLDDWNTVVIDPPMAHRRSE